MQICNYYSVKFWMDMTLYVWCGLASEAGVKSTKYVTPEHAKRSDVLHCRTMWLKYGQEFWSDSDAGTQQAQGRENFPFHHVARPPGAPPKNINSGFKAPFPVSRK